MNYDSYMNNKNENNEQKDLQKMIRTLKKRYQKDEKRNTLKRGSPTLKNETVKKIKNSKKRRYNEQILEMLERMEQLMKKRGDIFRMKAYARANNTVSSIRYDITDIRELEGKPGIGASTIIKIEQYIKTGTLEDLEKEKENPMNWLIEIHGIGPKKAEELVKKGIYQISDLENRQDELLNNTQKLGLKYYEDIKKRIPRFEIDDYNKLFQKEFNKLNYKDGKYEIVGSYRRGSENSGDIDVIITSKNQNIFKEFVDSMIKNEIILETLSYGNTKALVIAKLPNYNIARRVDFLYSPPDEFPFAILYFTGSKEFNTVMRSHALTMNLSLNEHGLYEKKKGEEKGEKINKNFKEEKDIFEHLKLKYKKPEHRLNGNCVEII